MERIPRKIKKAINKQRLNEELTNTFYTRLGQAKIKKVKREKLSDYVIEHRKQKTEHRAKIAYAVMLKLLKQKEKREQQLKANLKNKQDMEKFRTVYIESKLTKKRFKVPRWKAEKYCKKWFIQSTKLDYKEQERLQREERKSVSLDKLEKFTHTVTDKVYRGLERGKNGKLKVTKDGKKIPIYETFERTITAYGIPKDIFNGLTRQQRRDNPKGIPGDGRLKHQTITVTPTEVVNTIEVKRRIGRTPATQRPNSPLYDPKAPVKEARYKTMKRNVTVGKLEDKIISWNEPQYEFTKETFNFYKKVDNPDPIGKKTHPKIKTDEIFGTTEIERFVKTWKKKMTRKVTREIPTYRKTIVTIQLESQQAKRRKRK